MKIAVYGRQGGSAQGAVIDSLAKLLPSPANQLLLYQPFYSQIRSFLGTHHTFQLFNSAADIRGQIDFLLSVGGDGTMLDTLSLVHDSGIPVLGINTGRLGFLSAILPDELHKAVEALQQGHYSLDRRSLIRLESDHELFGGVSCALNELTIHKKDSSSMIIINTFINGEYLNSYWADGLIIATPTGSTGYSLSCGGPIIVPHSDNFVITPIAPHNLNVRPIVVSDKNVISLEVEGRSQYFIASLDARSVTIDSGIRLAVRKEDFTMNLVRMDTDNFLGTLRAKLKWGLDIRN